ncbi:hypothetical protein BYT27DRAFT_7192406 [Phlegmacium glaucopus]|nr:hypothetical protein BYT27DRAFT_7192406 [Phlegmacium glaucopus]
MDPNPHNWQCSSSQLQQPSPPLPAVKPFDMRELLASLPNTMPLGEGSTHDHQHQLSGLTRNQQKRRHKTEAPSPYRRIRISSGTITSDRSTGAQPVYARMGAFDDTGAGEVGPPSGNPQMVNHKSINRRQIQANYRRRQRVKVRLPPVNLRMVFSEHQERHDIYGSGLSQTQRGKEDPSVYKIPVLDFQSMMVSQSIHHLLFTALCSRCDSRSFEYTRYNLSTSTILRVEIG